MLLERLVIPIGFDTGGIGTTAISGIIDAVSGAVNKAKDFLADSVGEAMKSQDVIAQLDAVLKSTGGSAGVTRQQALDLASSFQNLTKFSDEAVLEGENMLLTFTSIGKDVFPRATETILDMSTALKQDLKSSAIQLGKALNDPITGVTALRRVGVQFTDQQEKMIKQMVESGDLMKAQTFILDELQKEFGGSAKAAGETFGGQLEILKNKVSDIKERIGGALLPVLGSLAERFSNLIDSPRVQSLIDAVVAKLEGAGNWIETNLPIWESRFDEFWNVVEEKGFWAAIKEELGKLDVNVAEMIESLPFREWGRSFGDAIDAAISGFFSGKPGEDLLPKSFIALTDGLEDFLLAAMGVTSWELICPPSKTHNH